MGLKEAFQKGAQAAVKAFGNVAETVSISRTIQDYDSTTNELSDVTTTKPVKMIESKFTSEEIRQYSTNNDIAILPTDIKGLIAYLDMPVAFRPPKPGDEITRGTEVLEVKSFLKTPADAMYTVQLRKS